MRVLRTLVLTALALLASAVPGAARVQGQMYCWALDSEFPVPCDPPEEEDEPAAPNQFGARLSGVN
jgi:hypothetical protein